MSGFDCGQHDEQSNKIRPTLGRPTALFDQFEVAAMQKLMDIVAEKDLVEEHIAEMRDDLEQFESDSKEKNYEAMMSPFDKEAAEEARKATAFKNEIVSDKNLEKSRLKELEVAELKSIEQGEHRNVRKNQQVGPMHDTAMFLKQEIAISDIFTQTDTSRALLLYYYNHANFIRMQIQFFVAVDLERHADKEYGAWAMKEAEMDVASVIEQSSSSSPSQYARNAQSSIVSLFNIWQYRCMRDEMVLSTYKEELRALSVFASLGLRTRLRFDWHRAKAIYKADLKAAGYLLAKLQE